MSDRRVMLPDGTTVVVEGVPDNVPDADVKRYVYETNKLGPSVSVGEDVKRGAKSAPVSVTKSAAMLLPLLGTALGHGTNTLVEAITGKEDPFIKEKTRSLAADVPKAEAFVNRNIAPYLPPDYQPETWQGRFGKAGTEGMMMAPVGGGGSGAAGVLKNLALGAGSGMAQQGATELGADPVTAGAVGAAPFGLASILTAMRTGTSFKAVRKALEQLTPEDRAVITKRLGVNSDIGIDAAPWQVSPDNTSLHTLGQRTAANTHADLVQELLKAQRTTADPGRIQGQINDLYTPTATRQLTTEEVQSARDAALSTIGRKTLAGADKRAVQKTANEIGIDQKVKMTDPEALARIQELNQQMTALPAGDPAKAALHAEFVSLLQGNRPSRSVFKPKVGTEGEVSSIRQQVGGEANPVDLMVATDVKNQLAQALGPDYFRNVGKTAAIKDATAPVVQSVAELAGKQGATSAQEAAKLNPASELVYAAATNPMWASVPIVKNMVAKTAAKDLDKMMSVTSMKDLERLAKTNPQLAAKIRALLSVQQGLVNQNKVTLEEGE